MGFPIQSLMDGSTDGATAVAGKGPAVRSLFSLRKGQTFFNTRCRKVWKTAFPRTLIKEHIMKKYLAEVIGTFWLVLGGAGSAMLAAGAPDVGIGYLGVALAFGLTVVTMAYAIGHISGCHLNPAVSIGLVVAGRFPAKDLLPYMVSQVVGGLAGAGVLYLVVTGKAGAEIGGFAANGYGDLSPGKYSMAAALITEVVLTAVFLLIILGATDRKAHPGLAPVAIGLGLTLIHLFAIPVTNCSVNPARSLATAVFAGGDYLSQVWLFWVAPIVGAVIGAILYKVIDPSLADEQPRGEF